MRESKSSILAQDSDDGLRLKEGHKAIASENGHEGDSKTQSSEFEQVRQWIRVGSHHVRVTIGTS